MIKKIENFIKILIVELDDLHEDIKVLIKECNEKHLKEKITEYVFLENLAVLKNELFGVEGFIEDVRSLNIEKFADIKALSDYLMNLLHERVHEKGLAPSILNLVDRKIQKVTKYVDTNFICG